MIKKLGVIGLIIFILLGIGIYTSSRIHSFYVESKLDARQELDTALSNMAAESEYKYKMLSEFMIDDRKEVISEVTGEKSNGNAHIKGAMVNTDIDIYYIDRTIYNYDALAKKWLVIDSGTDKCEDLLIAELNPLSHFQGTTYNVLNEKGFEKINDIQCMVVSGTPIDKSQLLETYWQDVECDYWIDYKNKRICQAKLRATNRKNPNTKLNIELNLHDFGSEIDIKPPDISK